MRFKRYYLFTFLSLPLLFVGIWLIFHPEVVNAQGGNCIPFRGISEEVSVQGGKMNYEGAANNDGGFDFVDFAACANTQAENKAAFSYPADQNLAYAVDLSVDPVYRLQGWVWNTNVGWVSMRCNDGGPGGAANDKQNRAIACGQFPYVSWVDQEGFLHGWWWGVDTGWIRLDWWCDGDGDGDRDYIDSTFGPAGGCSNPITDDPLDLSGGAPFIAPYDFDQVKVMNSGGGTSTLNFVGHGTVFGYVWSEKLGWISLQNLTAPFIRVCTNLNDPDTCWHTIGLDITLNIWATTDNAAHRLKTLADTIDPLNYNNIPYANGSDFWNLTLEVVDPAGTNITLDNHNGYTITVTPTWADTIYKDQISNASSPAVSKTTLTFSSDYAFHQQIASSAPTWNMNGFYDNTISPWGFTGYYDDILLRHYVCLESIDININAPPGIPDFNETYTFGTTCADTSTSRRASDPFDINNNHVIEEDGVFRKIHLWDGDLLFKPMISFNDLTSLNEHYIVASRNTPFPIELNIQAPGRGLIPEDRFYFGIEIKKNPDAKFTYIVDENNDSNFDTTGYLNCAPGAAALEDALLDGHYSDYTPAIPNGFPATIKALPYWQASCGLLSDFEDLSPKNITSFIVYDLDNNGADLNDVRYPSRSLYFNTSGVVNTSNPLIKVEGSISSSGEVAIYSGEQLASIGNITYGITREQILKNVRALTRDSQADPASPDDIEALWHDATSQFDITPSSAVDASISDGKVIHVYGDLYIGDTTAPTSVSRCINWSGEYTFIVEGGNVFIHDQLCTNQSNAKIGIIVLRLPGQDLLEAGNIYVPERVTDIHANMYADGALMRYDFSNPPVSSGAFNVPPFPPGVGQPPSVIVRSSKLIHQLYVRGSLSSANTIGGVDAGGIGASRYRSCYGQGTDDLFVAQSCDLNFLSYFRVFEDPDTSKNIRWNDGFCSNTIGNFDNAMTGSKQCVDRNNRSVYFIYDAPSSTLPGFSSESVELK